MIAAVVFSRDRACQLDLLLRSLRENAPGLFHPLTVIWHATAVGFHDGYEICAAEHPEATFLAEGPELAQQVLKAIDGTKHLSFFTDDDVLFRPLDSPHRILEEEDGVVCVSLRLGMNTIQCYPLRRPQQWPTFTQRGDMLVWDWASAEGDFSYPGSIDGHIFRGDTPWTLLSGASYANPNWLEDALMRRIGDIGKPLMACYPESRLVSIPANKVTDSHVGNRHGEDHPASTAELQERYVNGERIDFDAMDFSDVCGAHHELPYVFA